MTSQPQRDDSEGQRRDDGQPSKASQTAADRGATLGMDELNNSPKDALCSSWWVTRGSPSGAFSLSFLHVLNLRCPNLRL